MAVSTELLLHCTIHYCRLSPLESAGVKGDEDEEKRRNEEFINNIIKEFSAVTEDDDIGMLANKLGPADLTGIPQLTDKSVGPFLAEHNTAIVTFYQKCECTLI